MHGDGHSWRAFAAAVAAVAVLVSAGCSDAELLKPPAEADAPLPTVPSVPGAARLEGLMGTWPENDVSKAFWHRLLGEDPSLTVATGAAAAYDAAVIVGLAAEIARTDAPSKLAAEVVGLTTEGAKCSTFATCKKLTDQMTDIDYDGQSGAIELQPGGDPGEASYAVGRIDGEGGLEKSSVRAAAVQEPGAPPRGDAELNPLAGPPADGRLIIGTVLPRSGPQAEEAKAQLAAVRLAVADMNTAGGVLGERVELVQGDSGPAGSPTARATVADQLARGVDVIIGPPSSAAIEGILDEVTQAGVVLFGPTATGTALGAADRGLFFRLTPSDALQADALADVVTGEGVLAVTAVVQGGAAWQGLLPDLSAGLQRSGASVTTTVVFDPADPAAPSTVAAVRTATTEAVVFLGDEGPLSELMDALLSAGSSPEKPRWFTMNLSPRLGERG